MYVCTVIGSLGTLTVHVYIVHSMQSSMLDRLSLGAYVRDLKLEWD